MKLSPLKLRVAGLCMIAAAAAGLASHAQLLNRVEGQLYDLRVRWLARSEKPSDQVVMVAIDDQSLDALEPRFGRWPWPRDVFAEVIRRCALAQAIVLDVIFPEVDLVHPEGDAALVRSVREQGRVIMSVYLDDEQRPLPVMPGAWNAPGDLPTGLRRHASALAPFPALLEAGAGFGFVNYLADPDGVTRRHTAIMRLEEQPIPSLALSAVLHQTGRTPGAASTSRDHLQVAGHRLALDELGRFRMLPALQEFKTYSLSDLFDPASAPAAEAFRGKLVLIGSLATGLQSDRQVTSVSVYAAGVETIATAADNLLRGRSLDAASPAVTWLLIIILCSFPLWHKLDRPLSMLAAGAGLAALYAAVNCLVARVDHLMLPVAVPLLGLALAHAGAGTLYWRRERVRRRDLELIDRAKQRFTDMLVHDLRNRATPLYMALTMMESTAGSRKPEEADLVKRASESARRLIDQVNSLLDIRKMEEGRLHLSLSTVPLRQLLDNVMNEYAAAARRASLRLELTTPAPEPHAVVQADQEILARVLGNLVWNAIKFGERETPIVLGGGLDEGGAPMITVANHGEPIPAAQREELFLPFMARAREQTIEARSTGLGLTFCKMAMEAHGGSIELKSPWLEPADGVVVTLRFPRIRQSLDP